jgi:hypothetical protein
MAASACPTTPGAAFAVSHRGENPGCSAALIVGRAAVMYSLIVTAKMNDIDSQAGLADVLARIDKHPVQRLDELLPWIDATEPSKSCGAFRMNPPLAMQATKSRSWSSINRVKDIGDSVPRTIPVARYQTSVPLMCRV